MYSVLVRSVDICLGSRNYNLYFVLVLARRNDTEICADFVVSFCTP